MDFYLGFKAVFVDRKLFYLVSFLLSFSVVLSYSLGVYAVDYYDYGEFHFVIRQMIAVGFGILIMWILSQIPADKLIMQLGFFILFSSIFFTNNYAVFAR